MTKLEIVNKFFFQFLFVRLTRCVQEKILDAGMNEVSILPDGNYGMGFQKIKSVKFQWYSLQGWIMPFTGWNSDFIILGKRWFVGKWFYKTINDQLA